MCIRDSIATMLADIDNLIDAHEVIEKLENRQKGDSGFFGTQFGKPEED